ncbi:MAG TPA: T9SS type A sorting domain-containing protein, partial [Flavobacterium sp.]|nr:T9SS type A sorting domain-containing protein [Flavobacterium sp.]
SLLNITMDAANIPESYTVYNSLGQVMGTGAITSATQTLNIAPYAEGVYFIKLEKGHEAQTMQFIKY